VDGNILGINGGYASMPLVVDAVALKGIK